MFNMALYLLYFLQGFLMDVHTKNNYTTTTVQLTMWSSALMKDHFLQTAALSTCIALSLCWQLKDMDIDNLLRPGKSEEIQQSGTKTVIS